MKLTLILFISLIALRSFAESDPEDVDGLTLVAPKSATAPANSEVEEPVKKRPATTEEILAAKGMLKKEVEEKTMEEQKQVADFGDVEGVEKYKITCVLNNDTREISAIEQADGTIGIRYTKFGESKTIAIAKNNPDYVNQVAEKIQNNLANGQYPYACTKEESSN